MGDSERGLKDIRDRIDAVDGKLLDLLNERARLAQEVAAIKRRGAASGPDGTGIDVAGEGSGGEGDGAGIYRPEREAEVLRRVGERNRGPLPREHAEHLFREIMSACRALQRTMRIAFLGPQGTFTEAAALKHFGYAIEEQPLESIDAVFREVESGSSDFGVVPVENSTEGVVTHTLDMFMTSSLEICGEVQLRIHHCLLAAGGGRDAVTRVYSHQQSFAQCRKWLDTNLPGAERVAVGSNAEGARRAASEPGAAAIAGAVAAERYGLAVLEENVEDEPDNTTRFLVIGRGAVPLTGSDKTALLLSAQNKPGALYRLLEPFARRGVSMTRIESRPARSRLWEYVFFVDIEGHASDPNVADALAEIESNAALFRVLGSFPRAAR